MTTVAGWLAPALLVLFAVGALAMAFLYAWERRGRSGR